MMINDVPKLDKLKSAEVIFWGEAGHSEFGPDISSKTEVVTSFKVVKRQRGLLFGNVKVNWNIEDIRCHPGFKPGEVFYILANKKDGQCWTSGAEYYWLRETHDNENTQHSIRKNK